MRYKAEFQPAMLGDRGFSVLRFGGLTKAPVNIIAASDDEFVIFQNIL